MQRHPPLRLSVLDFGTRNTWADTSRSVLEETTEQAILVEGLGYHRYWLAEHQSASGAWGNSVPLVAHLASRTRTLRIGPAGILAACCDPFQVAQDYRLLEGLYPGRIDIGLARGQPSQAGLRPRFASQEDFIQAYAKNAGELIRLLRVRYDRRTIEEGATTPVPSDVTLPVPWSLGSGAYSCDVALRMRTAFCYSIFHHEDPNPAMMQRYSSNFVPHIHCSEPKSAIALCVICAASAQEADAIDRDTRQRAKASKVYVNVVGDADHCAHRISALAASYAVDEVVLLALGRNADERTRCFGLLAAKLLNVH